jgi:hypothetical protein
MKKLITFLSSIYFLLFSSNAFAQRYPSLAGSAWVSEKFSSKAWDYSFFENGNCKFGYYDLWYSSFTDCKWYQDGEKIKIVADQGFLIGVWIVEGWLYGEEFQGKRTYQERNPHYPQVVPFKMYATNIDKWIVKEVPKPKLEPRVDNRVTEKYSPPKTSINEPLRGREKAKELFSDKFDSAIKAGLGAAFGVLVLFGIDSITGGRIEKKFNLKIAYAIAAFIGWMLTKFI